MSRLSELSEHIASILGDSLVSSQIRLNELTCEIRPEDIIRACETLRDDKGSQFDQLIDLCGMDYSTYGQDENPGGNEGTLWPGSRYAVVYHLLSLNHNVRIRLRCGLDENQPTIDSVNDVWAAADWFEREAFDLFGIIFKGHTDLRRLLTDYGFIGHPFRKDFPLSGQVEMRFDEEQKRVIYQPVTVEDRILVPRTIRKDSFVKSKQDNDLSNNLDEAAN